MSDNTNSLSQHMLMFGYISLARILIIGHGEFVTCLPYSNLGCDNGFPLFILLESYLMTREWWLSSRISEATTGLVFLLQHDAGDSGPDMSFDTSASPEYMSGLDRASLAKMVRCASLSEAPEETIPHQYAGR
ncbi:hypothetical protein Tco_1064730 [Tanacetum coccineum]